MTMQVSMDDLTPAQKAQLTQSLAQLDQMPPDMLQMVLDMTITQERTIPESDRPLAALLVQALAEKINEKKS